MKKLKTMVKQIKEGVSKFVIVMTSKAKDFLSKFRKSKPVDGTKLNNKETSVDAKTAKKEREVVNFLKKHKTVKPTKEMLSSLDQAVFESTKIEGIKPRKTFELDFKGLFANTYFKYSVAVFSSLFIFLLGLSILGLPVWLFLRRFWVNVTTNPVYAPIEVVATASTNYGVSRGATFIIKTDEGVDSRLLAESISISPEIEFEITTEGESLLIVPVEELSADTIYVITVPKDTKISSSTRLAVDLSFVFVTEPDFKVTGTTPRNGVSGPADTALEIEFSYNNVVLDSFTQRFYVTPARAGEFLQVDHKIVFVPTEPLVPGVSYTFGVTDGVETADGRVLASGVESTFIATHPKDYDIEVGYFMPTLCATDGEGLVNTVDNLSSCDFYDNGLTKRDVTAKIFAVTKEQLVRGVVEFSNMRPDFVDGLTPVWSTTVGGGDYGKYSIRPGITAAGIYMLELSMSFPTGETSYNYEYIIVSDLSAVWQQYNNSNNVWITNAGANAVIPNATVEAYGDDSIQLATVQTDSNGLAAFDSEGVELIVASIDGKYVTVAPSRYYYGNFSWRTDLVTSVVLDRPYYSYGDKVQFKGIVRDKNTLLTVPLNINSIRVEVVTQMYEFGISNEKVITQYNVPFNPVMGTFSGEFYLPSSISGSVYLNLKVGDNIIESKNISIAELENVSEVTYELSTRTEIFSHKSSVDVFIDGYYANGSPVLSEMVDLNVSVSRAMFYGIPEGTLTKADMTASYSAESYIISNVEIEEGRAVVSIDTSACPDLCRYNISVQPKEEYGYSTSKYAYFTVNNIDTYLVAESVKETYNSGEAFTVNASAVTLWTGAKVPGISVTGTLQRTWYEPYVVNEYNPETKRTEPVTKYNRHVDTCWSGSATTDSSGNLSFNIPNSGEGSYDLNIVFTGAGGSLITLPRPVNWYVYGSTSSSGYAQVLFDKDSYAPGETSVISVTGVSEGYMYFQIQSSANKVDYVVNLAQTNSVNYTVPQNGVGQISVNSHYQVGVNKWRTSYDSAVVDRSDKKLTISFEGIADSYLPGQEVSFVVSVKDSSGNLVNGEVAIDIFDSRLDSVDSDYDLFNEFYGQYVSMFSSSYYYSLLYLPGYGAGGGGVGFVRSDFERLAYWNDTVTLEDGKATITFKLPDTITSWNAYAIAYTADSKFGYGKDTLVSTQDIYVSVPELQFIREGDTVTLPVSVRNYTSGNVSGTLSVTATGCNVTEGASKNILMAPFRGSKMNVTLVPVGSADCVVTYAFTRGSTLLDGMEVKYDVFSNENLTTKAELLTVPAGETVNVSIDYTKIEYINSLTISNATNNPYDIASSFDIDTVSTQEVAALVLSQSLESDRNNEMLAFAQTVLANNVTNDGCFGWFSYDAGDIEATVYGYIALNQLLEWGYDVSDISKVETYLENILQSTAVDNKYKTMTIWGLSFSQNHRALAAALNLVSDGETLTDLSYGYLLYALNNFGATGQGIGIANRLIQNATKSEKMAWWSDLGSISAGSDNDRYVTAIIALALKPYNGDAITDKVYRSAIYYVQNTTYKDSKNIKNFFIVLASGFLGGEPEPLDVSVSINDQSLDWDLSYDSAIIPEELLVSGENSISVTNNGATPVVLKLEYYKPIENFAVSIPAAQEIFNVSTGAPVSRNRINVGDTIVVRTQIDPINDSGTLVGSSVIPTGYRVGYPYNVDWDTYQNYLKQLPDTVSFMYSSSLTPRFFEYFGRYDKDTSRVVIDQILTCHFAGSATVGETFVAIDGDRSIGVLLSGTQITCVE
ncbi:hypothetical protein JW962_03765 [Candidatus Dojkabacteria bacterium]|nr:hypothetical protein [Candidatus Dojkabacteria bacterium]